MGMPTISTISTITPKIEEEGLAIEEPRHWCKEDGDPEEETWWNSRPLYTESFVAASKEGGVADPQRQHVAPNDAARKQNETLPLNSPSPKDQHSESQSALSVVFGGRRTITEEELASVSLDTFPEDEDEYDFELDWEDDDEGDDTMDVAECASDASTPAPSTPVIQTRVLPLPVAVPTTPRRRQTMPISPSSVTLRTGSFQASSSKFSTTPKSPSIVRSVTRVRGFALASPRTELVL